MVDSPHRFWLAARLTAVTAIAVIAIVFLSSWVLAILVGALTTAAVAIDGWLLSRNENDQIAVDPNATPADKLTVDLSRRL